MLDSGRHASGGTLCRKLLIVFVLFFSVVIALFPLPASDSGSSPTQNRHGSTPLPLSSTSDLLPCRDSAVRALWDAMLTWKQKEAVMEVRRHLVEAASKENLPIKMSLGKDLGHPPSNHRLPNLPGSVSLPFSVT